MFPILIVQNHMCTIYNKLLFAAFTDDNIKDNICLLFMIQLGERKVYKFTSIKAESSMDYYSSFHCIHYATFRIGIL